MSEPVHTEITVSPCHLSKAIQILKETNSRHFFDYDLDEIDDLKNDDDYYRYCSEKNTCILVLGDISDGYVQDESNALVAAGIAHNIYRATSSYSDSSYDFIRFDAAGKLKKYTDQPSLVALVDASQVLKVLKEDGTLKAQDFLEKFLNENGKPSWENQVENGEKYVKNMTK